MLSILLRIAPVLVPALWLLVTIVILAVCRSASRADREQRREAPRRSNSGATSAT